MENKQYKPAAITLYLGMLMAGISMSILGQYKADFAQLWHTDLSGVLNVMAATGIGGVIASFISGPLSDKLGRKVAAVIGLILQGLYYFGIIMATSVPMAYTVVIIGAGIGNSFVQAGTGPALIEIFPKNSTVANLVTKLFMSVGEFALPILIFLASVTGAGYRSVFIISGIIYLILAVFMMFQKFPKPGQDIEQMTEETKEEAAPKGHITLGAGALALIGYTATAGFFLWLNTYQEFAVEYGMKNPSILQQLYAIASAAAVIVNALLMKKGFRESKILISYPLICAIGLILELLIHAQWILYVTALIVGFFAAGGLFQLATTLLAKMYPKLKGTAMSFANFMSMLANITILHFASLILDHAGKYGQQGIVILNIIVCLLGTVLALVVRSQEKKVIAENQLDDAN